MTLSTDQALMLGALMAAWLVLAVAATLWAWRAIVRARVDRGEARALRRLMADAPALPIAVDGDGSIRADVRVQHWFGLTRMPHTLSDLADGPSGISADDAQSLSGAVARIQRSAGQFTQTVRILGSDRELAMHGAPVPGRGIVIWAFDTTAMRADAARANAEADRTRRAFEALSRLIEAAPIPMWHRGPDLRLSLVNRAYVDAVDARDAEDAVGRGLELVEAGSGLSGIAAASAARDLGEATSRVVASTIGGQRRSLNIVDVPLGPSGVAGYAIDNDELERARVDFRRFVEAQRDTLDQLSAGVAQFGADRALTFSNLPFQRLFSLKPEWLADRPEFDRVLERMRETGRVPEVRDFPAWKVERRDWFTNPGGATQEAWHLPGGTHLRVVAQPLPDGGLTAIFEDRTEQMQLASARDTLLRVREATFDNLFEAVGVFASDGRLQVWNNRFRDLWGFDDALLATHPRVEALAAAASPMLTNPARASLIRELVRAATLERKARSGRVALANGRHFEFAAVPLPDGNALLTMLDITDSRRIERALRDRAEALVASDRVKTAFVANMSYELRTPLTSIGGFAEMLAAGHAGELPTPARDYVNAIVESVDRLAALIDDVIALTESDAGVTPDDRATVDIVALLTTLTDDRRDACAARGHVLIVDIDAGAGRCSGDARALKGALGAILDASINGIAANGRILVHARGDEAGAEIALSDDGPGRGGVRPEIEAARRIVATAGGTLHAIAQPGEGSVVQIGLPR